MNGICRCCNEAIYFDEPCIRLKKGKITLEDKFISEGYIYFHEECLIEGL